MSDVQKRIDELVKSQKIVLFMKGTRGAPQCGFSARVIDALDEYLPEYKTVNVLADPDVRSGIKEYSSWPTIPQLYVDGTFVGGCDIVTEMSQSGELADVLGVEKMELATPNVTLTAGALAALTKFQEGEGTPTVRVEITSGWQYGMDFDDPRPSDIVVEGEGYRLVLSRASARKADGMTIDFIEGPAGAGFKIDNPNEPPKVKLVDPQELKHWMDEGKALTLYDVRTDQERATASVEGAVALDDDARAKLEGAAEKTGVLVFMCHHGMRSQRAAQQALEMGYREVFNLAGGIDAWSQTVDPSVPRY